MQTLVTIIAILVTFAAFVVAVRQGAAFCNRFWPSRKWIPACVSLGIMLAMLGAMFSLQPTISDWVRCVAIVVFGFAGGIVVQMRQHIIRGS